MQVYFEKNSTTEQMCFISEKDLKCAKKSINQLHQVGNIIKTWSANDDSTLANALLDTLRLIYQEDPDFVKSMPALKNSVGPSTSVESLVGLMTEGSQ